MKYLLSFSLLFCFSYVANVAPEQGPIPQKAGDHPAPVFRFEKYKTEKISDTAGYFSQWGETYGIGVLKSRREVFLFHRETGEFRVFAVQGETPGKTGEVFQVTLLDDSSFCVFDQLRAYVFDVGRGKLSFECGPLIDKINYDRYSTPIALTPNDIILSVLDPDREITSAAYYSDPSTYFYATLDLRACLLRKGGTSAGDNSYRKEFYAVRLRPKISPFDDRSFLSFFPFHTAVDIVNAEDFSISKTIDLHPGYFGPLVTATGNGIAYQVAVMQANSAYRYVLASADQRYLLTQYKQGASEILPPEAYLSRAVTNLPGNKYFEMYETSSGKKIGRDSPDELGFIPLSFVSMDSVVFYSTHYQDEEGLFLHFAKITGLD